MRVLLLLLTTTFACHSSGTIGSIASEFELEPSADHDTADTAEPQTACWTTATLPCTCPDGTASHAAPAGECVCGDDVERLTLALVGDWVGTATAPEDWMLTASGRNEVDVFFSFRADGTYATECLTPGCASALCWGVDGTRPEKTYRVRGVLSDGGVAELDTVWEQGTQQTLDVEHMYTSVDYAELEFATFAPWLGDAGPIAYELSRCVVGL